MNDFVETTTDKLIADDEAFADVLLTHPQGEL